MPRRNGLCVLLMAALTVCGVQSSFAADKLKVGVFPVGAALPYYVALKRGYFAEANLEPETVVLNTPALLVQSLITGQIDAASNLVTLEAANINSRRPGTVSFVSLIGQNRDHVFEQFVVRADSSAKSIADLKGKKLFTSPGPANIASAKAILSKVGLKDGADYQMQEQPLNVQLGALKSGNFEGGYTLEPAATIMIKAGVARRIEAGVMSTYLLEKPGAETYAAGAVVSGELLKNRKDVAERYARATARAIDDIAKDPSVRNVMVSDLNIPESVIDDVPMPYFVMVKGLSEEQIADLQRFIDVGVGLGVVNSKVDAKTMLAPL